MFYEAILTGSHSYFPFTSSRQNIISFNFRFLALSWGRDLFFFSLNWRFLETVEGDFLDAAAYTDGGDNRLLCPQGMAFSLEERLQLGTHGLLPPCFIGQDVQLMRVLKNYDMRKDDLDRWSFHQTQDQSLAVPGHLLNQKHIWCASQKIYFLLIFPSPCFTSFL